MQIRNIVFNLILEHGASWDKVFDAVKNKEECPRFVSEEKNDYKSFMSLVDTEYPVCLKECNKPPFGIFYEGNIKLLSKEFERVFIVCDNPCTNKYNQLINDIGNQYVLVFMYSDNLINRIKLLPECPIIIWSSVPLSEIDKKVLQLITERDGLIITEYPGEAQLKERIQTRQKQTCMRATVSSNYALVIEAQDQKFIATVILATTNMGITLGCVPQDITAPNLNNSLLSEGAECVVTVDNIKQSMN